MVVMNDKDQPAYHPAQPGTESAPGLIIFRYDAPLFYANANRFVDDIERLIAEAPTPVEWLVIDASSIDDIDYSAGRSFSGLLDYLDAQHITPVVARADASVTESLEVYGVATRIPPEHRFATLAEAASAFRSRPAKAS
jgi:MFS superfamily sulfate permease-like transporter